MTNDYDDLINKDILDLMGYQNLTEEEKRNHYTRMLETIQNRAIARVGDLLSNEDQKTWESLQTDEEKKQFLASKNINLDQIMAEETLLYKAEMVAEAKRIQEELSKKEEK